MIIYNYKVKSIKSTTGQRGLRGRERMVVVLFFNHDRHIFIVKLFPQGPILILSKLPDLHSYILQYAQSLIVLFSNAQSLILVVYHAQSLILVLPNAQSLILVFSNAQSLILVFYNAQSLILVFHNT